MAPIVSLEIILFKWFRGYLLFVVFCSNAANEFQYCTPKKEFSSKSPMTDQKLASLPDVLYVNVVASESTLLLIYMLCNNPLLKSLSQ